MRSAPNSLTSLHSLSTLCHLNPPCRANTSASSEASPEMSSYSSVETLSWSWSSSSSSSSSSLASEKARKVEAGDFKEKEVWNLREKRRDRGRRRENERVVDETSFDSETLYEIECESSDPQRPKGLLEEFFARKREKRE